MSSIPTMPTTAPAADLTTPQATPASVSIGAVRYLNARPLIEGVEKARDARVVAAPPSSLLRLLEREEVDIGLSPVIDAQRSSEPLAFLPIGCIGCDGPATTVRLFSRGPIEKIARLHVDVDSHTSVALAQVLLAQRCDARPEIVPFEASSQDLPDAALLIGDKVVSLRADDHYEHSLDLSEAWREMTGLPFVFAVWTCLLRRAETPEVRLGAQLLDRQRRHNATRLDAIAATRAAGHGWPVGTAQRYLRSVIRYEVGPRERESIERFFDDAAAAGVIESRRPTRWAPE